MVIDMSQEDDRITNVNLYGLEILKKMIGLRVCLGNLGLHLNNMAVILLWINLN